MKCSTNQCSKVGGIAYLKPRVGLIVLSLKSGRSLVEARVGPGHSDSRHGLRESESAGGLAVLLKDRRLCSISSLITHSYVRTHPPNWEV